VKIDLHSIDNLREVQNKILFSNNVLDMKAREEEMNNGQEVNAKFVLNWLGKTMS
jgi:hypothetical protein